jgi:hypothetical protein
MNEIVGITTTAMAKKHHGHWEHLPDPPPPAPSRRRMRWTEQEERLLHEYYTSHGSRYVAALLGRTEQEDELLRRYYPIEPLKRVAERVGRTPQSVRTRVEKLGIARTGTSRKRS